MARFQEILAVSLSVIIAIQIVSIGHVFTLEYSPAETKLLNQFRDVMGNELYQDYMMADDFLMPWLRVRNMNLHRAQELLQNNLNWRRQNHIDNITQEDFTPFPEQYKLILKGHDHQGRPLLVAYFKSWDLRKIAVGGQTDKFNRFLNEKLESAAQAVRQANSTSPHHNVTQYTVVFDVSGYNLRQHGCLACIPIYARFVSGMELHYPLMQHKIFIVNTPAVAEAVMAIIRQLLNPETRKTFVVYGLDKNKWSQELLKLISADQLPERLGGAAH